MENEIPDRENPRPQAPAAGAGLKDPMLFRLTQLARNCGFTHVCGLKTETLKLRTEVRSACEADKCKSYGRSWSCPPACGSLEDCEKRIRQYSSGLLLQTTGCLEDTLDYEGMQRIEEEFDAQIRKFKTALPGYLVLGKGPCKACAQCTYPKEACRFPSGKIISMEAMGLIVSDVCTANGMAYYYGPNTISFTGCVLF